MTYTEQQSLSEENVWKSGMPIKDKGMKCGAEELVKPEMFGHLREIGREWTTVEHMLWEWEQPPVKVEHRVLGYLKEKGEKRLGETENVWVEC